MPASLMTLRPMGEARCAWVLEIDGRLQSGEAGWDALPRPPEGTRIRVLIPADRITHARASIAARNPRLIEQALPYALEEQLAEDIEGLCIAHGPRDGNGMVQARAMRRAELERLLERLHTHGIEPALVASELDVLPAPAEGWVTLAIGDLLLARAHGGEALALEPELLRTLLDGMPVQAIDTPEGPLPWLHRNLRERGMIDLHGSSPGEGLGERLRPWHTPALLAGLAFLLQAGLMLYEAQDLQRQRAAMQAEIERMAAAAAPEVRRWVNPVAQLRQLASGGTAASAEAGMLELLAALAPALTTRSDVRLGTVRFHKDTLEAQLSAAHSGSLEALIETLRKQGVAAELSEQRVEGGQATARLRLKGRQA